MSPHPAPDIAILLEFADAGLQSEDGSEDPSLKNPADAITAQLTPPMHAIRSRVLNSVTFPCAGSKSLVYVLACEDDLSIVEATIRRLVDIHDAQTGGQLACEVLSSKNFSPDNVKDLTRAFRSYDLVFVVRSSQPSRTWCRMVDQTVDLTSVGVGDVAAAIQHGFPNEDFELPASFSCPMALSFVTLDLLCAKSTKPSEVIDGLVAMTGPDDMFAPERLGLTNLFGYGEAEIWARRLTTDIAAYKDGRLPWRDVDAGALLVGPPGTGKTELVRRIAGEAGIGLIATSYSAWQSAGDGHLGDVTKAIRKTFEDALRNAPSIVFIDEIDSLPSREIHSKDHTWFWTVVNALLEAIDGNGGRDGVVVMAACNHAGRLDPALLRPGRLNRMIEIPLPDADALSKILAGKLGGGIEPVELLAMTTVLAGTATGADMMRIASDARRSARLAERPVCLTDVETAAFPRDTRSDADLHLIAVHESGHVLASMLSGKLPSSVTIRPTPGSEGSVRLKEVQKAVVRRIDLHSDLVVLLAGRSAEKVVFGEACVGSGMVEGSDLAKATTLAAAMAGRSGLDGLVYDHQPPRSAVESVLTKAEAEATGLLIRHQVDLEALAALLVERRTLTAHDLLRFADTRQINMGLLETAFRQPERDRETGASSRWLGTDFSTMEDKT